MIPAYAIVFDSNGNGTGSHKWMDAKTVVLAKNEIACTEAQAQNPSAWQVVNGVLVESLPAAQATQKTLLLSAYQSAVNAPITFKNSAGVTSIYPSGDTVLTNGMKAKDLLSNILSAGSTSWTLGKWLDTNNVAQNFTFSDLQGLAGAMESAITLDWTDLIQKIDQVNNATSVSAVKAITF